VISVASIAKSRQIPAKFLEQILLVLKRARYLRSSKGPNGGYSLAMDPKKISIAEIVRIFDGALAPTESVSSHFYEHTPIEKEKKITGLFRQLRNYISDKLESTSLADMM
jgi:Rrf2 family transcriptional regulator, cysteine metabolism repressor